jgi:hypothetical protein
LHGIAALSDSGRIPPNGQTERLDFLVTQIAATPSGPAVPPDVTNVLAEPS